MSSGLLRYLLGRILGLLFVIFAVALFTFVLSVRYHLLPTGGRGSPRQIIMPVIAYALGPLAVVAPYTRTSMAGRPGARTRGERTDCVSRQGCFTAV
ncbi:MAG: hypothetical protein ACR2JY_01700 [Chloroflexota bacterium]